MNTFGGHAVLRRTRAPWFPLASVPGLVTRLISTPLKISVRKSLVNLVQAPAILTLVGGLVVLAGSSNRWARLCLGLGQSAGLLLNCVMRHRCWAGVVALGEELVQMTLMIALKMCR
jgi:hypothetical protein